MFFQLLLTIEEVVAVISDTIANDIRATQELCDHSVHYRSEIRAHFGGADDVKPFRHYNSVL